MTENKMFDAIIVGTSPLAITEAIYLKKKGNSVLLIEQSGSVGGAWKTIKHEEIPEIEIGCHIWEVEKWSTEFIRRFFNLDLISLKIQPRIFKNKMSYPYDLKMNLITLKYIGKNLFKFKNLTQLGTNPALKFSFSPRKYEYPSGGGKAICSAVQQKVNEHNLSIHFNSKIQKIECEGELVRVQTNAHDFLCKNVVITSLSEIEKIGYNQKVIEMKSRKVDYIHVHLRLANSQLKDFSYIRWMGDPIIHRVSDMTFQVKDELNPDEQLICVGIHENAYHLSKEDEIVKTILESLKQRKLIGENTTVNSFAFNVYPSFYTEGSQLKQVEKETNGKIQVLWSTNFVYSFFYQKEKYKELL